MAYAGLRRGCLTECHFLGVSGAVVSRLRVALAVDGLAEPHYLCPMATLAFDMRQVTKDLQATGLTEMQAEGIARAIRQARLVEVPADPQPRISRPEPGMPPHLWTPEIQSSPDSFRASLAELKAHFIAVWIGTLGIQAGIYILAFAFLFPR